MLSNIEVFSGVTVRPIPYRQNKCSRNSINGTFLDQSHIDRCINNYEESKHVTLVAHKNGYNRKKTSTHLTTLAYVHVGSAIFQQI